jgi:hypothetical protein
MGFRIEMQLLRPLLSKRIVKLMNICTSALLFGPLLSATNNVVYE